MAKYPERDYPGSDVFILGGGPSLKQILPDPNVLNGKVVIATNNAFKLTPRATVFHFADLEWYRWNEADIPLFTGKYKTTAAVGKSPGWWQPRGITWLNIHDYYGLARSNTEVSGSNAGHQAINIAVHLGASRIILIGFDMKTDSMGNAQWHNEHQRATRLDRYEDLFIPGFKSTVEPLERLGIEVYNVNPDSALKCFPFRPLSDFVF